MKGQVLRVIAGYYDVLSGAKTYRVRGSGNLRNEKNNPLVGDFVEFTEDGFLSGVEARVNQLIRPKVANVEQAVIVTSLAEPAYASYLLNKMLATVEAQKITPILVFTKKDLSDLRPNLQYAKEGYQTFLVNSLNKDGVPELRRNLAGKLTVFMGQTGVGKSSLINALLGLTRETQAISKNLGRGKHTTRVVEIEIYKDIKIIDTPGFSSFELSLTKIELAHSFHDFAALSQQCKFRSCIHVNERLEDCAVKQAVQQGKISSARYEDYLKMNKEIK